MRTLVLQTMDFQSIVVDCYTLTRRKTVRHPGSAQLPDIHVCPDYCILGLQYACGRSEIDSDTCKNINLCYSWTLSH